MVLLTRDSTFCKTATAQIFNFCFTFLQFRPFEKLKTIRGTVLSLARRQTTVANSVVLTLYRPLLSQSRRKMSSSNFSSTPTSTGTLDAIRDTNTISLSDLARSKTFLNWTRPLPTFIVPSSRGSVPHLTPDNLHQHTKIPSIHIGLEDFISPPPAKSPIFGIQTSLQKYLAYPDSTTVVFAARRANPVPINSSWNDKIEINTVDGRNTLPVEIFINAIQQVKLRQQDIVIGIPDTTESPGVKRLGKMVERTQGWLEMLLKTQVIPYITMLMIAGM
jgi:hypothetical protein